jgi:hypothetical protein
MTLGRLASTPDLSMGRWNVIDARIVGHGSATTLCVARQQ